MTRKAGVYLPTYANRPRSILENKRNMGNSCYNTFWAMSNFVSRGTDLCTVAQNGGQSVASTIDTQRHKGGYTTAVRGEVLVAP